MASYVAAYRVGMLVSSAGALFLVSGVPGAGFGDRRAWTACYVVMAALVLIGVTTTLLATEPRVRRRRKPTMPCRATAIRSSARSGRRSTASAISSRAISRSRVLAFVVLFKFTDALAFALTTPFVLDLGFSLHRNSRPSSTASDLSSTLIGGFAGGFVARACSLSASLWIGGLLQTIIILAFSWQAVVGHNVAMLTFDHRHRELHRRRRHGDLRRLPLGAVPQSAVHGDAIRAPDRARGLRAQPICRRVPALSPHAVGWAWFFVICALAGLPALVLLAWLQKRRHFDGLAPAKK